MTDITNPLDHMPRRDVSVNAGAVSIEQERAIAEATTETNCAASRERQRINTHGAIASTLGNSVTHGSNSGPLRNTILF